MSSHIYGFEKILEVKWTLDEEHGGGFILPDANGNLFAEEFALEAKNENARRLKEIIVTSLRKPQTNVRLYEIVLSNEFLPKHANEVLKEIQKENPKFHVNDINSGKPARKGAFYLSYSYYNSDPKVEIYIEK